jgi:N-acetylmuramoyl-L-alanine amidase
MKNLFTIVFDPGHGGTTPADGSTPNNAVGPNGLLEKDLTLHVARSAAAKLPSDRFQTLLTRTDDRNLSLVERARKSREIGADAFVSIHFNGNRDASVDGTEVFVSSASEEKDSVLGRELVKNVSLAAAAPSCDLRKADFTVLKGSNHVAKTAACLLEIAYLSNPQQAKKLLSPDYIDGLATAVARSLVNYSNRASASAASLETSQSEEKLVDETAKEHSDPKNFPIDLPEPGKGTDTIKFTIPKGMKFSRWEVEVLAMSTGAGYKVPDAPKLGAEGSHKISVDWWYLPYGKFNYKLKIYASPDGSSSGGKIMFDSAGWMEKAKDQITQGVPLKLGVKGEKAKQIYEAMQKHQDAQTKPAGLDDVSVAMEPITITVVILVGIVIFGILVVLGMLTLGAIIKMALDKGYNVKDTKYKAGVGEGQLRQDHEIAFNLMRPEK